MKNTKKIISLLFFLVAFVIITPSISSKADNLIPRTNLEISNGQVFNESQIRLRGWGLNASGIKAIDIYVDGTWKKTLVKGDGFGLSRPDVKQAFPEYPDADYSGYDYYMYLPDGNHTLRVWAIGNDNSKVYSEANITVDTSNSKGTQLVNYARKFIGVPYVWGGDTPNGFDCSGLVMYCYAHFGVNLPHYTGDQVKYGTVVTDLQPGDLLFFGSTSDPYHVAIYSGNGYMIEAPKTGENVHETPVRSYSIAKRIF
ncbi:hypothetical protein BJV85_001226 [Clostridium acetobutylicum]|uniref:Protein containing cell-wall hydrolase domain n=1 Tax=Clostridium acetobutylicum (strain ATCC 824 / DSM 792 / JCM 1419 / IAM 19013 / LMG 5710 / NBRC 13948 / NRRL B-527 / VKM B-1787 / 2291 / W) TaxID=272562 RepID=Q97FR4_CLOAB|nr:MULTISPECIES: C40 family peptidase [Clostridium]AAK80610.1 Protein containing cell-wall hydrolase domain [Clostridium acetobutylicum ATCC 824]ADZ21709.1 Protein containing cell-wall hydrolase domain [Clostridium acetobutylicum EA 2018]AEI33111.1 cell-wall hydrolase domain-containing protein [Clostridium acetobutylicum DSM 1731]AWV78973.1 peptidoglycan endopeptidase [Clostridium acetobutylicum]MBC2395067.1 peptidoglycan endopeptidase [Clostridium acetobutylicum]